MLRFALALGVACALHAAEPFLEKQNIFAPEHWHNHSSSIVELPNGDLLAVWYNGSGERTADDVKIEGARLRKGKKEWGPRFTVADTPGFPDCNPALFVDSKQRLWLFWPVIIANEWHTGLLKYRVSTDYKGPGNPKWQENESLLAIPRNFAASVKRQAESNFPNDAHVMGMIPKAADKYFARMGWMPRARPTELPSGRLLVPLYSDGFDFSLIAITDDGGATWSTSEPIVGNGPVQPTIARRRDGTLVAYFRDNGPAPKRILQSDSRDEGVTWSKPIDLDLPNPGAGIEVHVLRDGTWALLYNDLEKDRWSLALSLSDDEGKTWKWTRHVERDEQNQPRSSFHYPSLLQGRDGTIHLTYSYFQNHIPAGGPRKTIRYAHLNLDWVKAQAR